MPVYEVFMSPIVRGVERGFFKMERADMVSRVLGERKLLREAREAIPELAQAVATERGLSVRMNQHPSVPGASLVDPSDGEVCATIGVNRVNTKGRKQVG